MLTENAGATPESTYERLLNAAASLFWTKGYAATTTRELAAMLGVQKASLYYHVERKEDLLNAICLRALDHIHTAAAAAIASESEPLAQVQALIGAHVNAMLEDREKHATMLTELRALTGTNRADILARRDRYAETVRSTLAGAQSAGVLRTDVPAKYMALAFLDLLNWAIFWYDSSGELTAPMLARLFTTMFLEGTRETAR